MKRQLTITTMPIDETALLTQRSISASMGAAVCFLGVVRGTEGKAMISALEYRDVSAHGGAPNQAPLRRTGEALAD